MEELEREAARAIPPVIDTAADVYEGGQSVWNDAQDLGRTGLAVGEIAYDTMGYGVRAAEEAAARPVAWTIDQAARAAEAFGWIAD